MKALSLRQPWWVIVLHYGKRIENRCWNTRFRGEFLIHAAKGMPREEYDDAEDFTAHALGWKDRTSGLLAQAEFARDFRERDRRGGIVGIARLVDVIPPCVPKGGLFAECGHQWHIPQQWGFRLEDVRPLPFVPCKGERGFFDVPEDVVKAAMATVPNG
jgi:hypothetical protein